MSEMATEVALLFGKYLRSEPNERGMVDTGIRTAEQALAGVWELDPEHTTVEFAVKHMMFTTVRGRFGGATGRVELGAARRWRWRFL
jgi:polyisoprenoid-binding protein YceI